MMMMLMMLTVVVAIMMELAADHFRHESILNCLHVMLLQNPNTNPIKYFLILQMRKLYVQKS